MWPFNKQQVGGKSWQETVDEVKREHPEWPLKNILKEAKKRYKKK